MHVPKECYGARDMYEYFSKDIYASLRNPPFALPRRILTFLTVIVPFTIFWSLLSYDRLPSFLSSGPSSTPSISHWQGWANVENMFVLYAPKRRQVEKRKAKTDTPPSAETPIPAPTSTPKRNDLPPATHSATLPSQNPHPLTKDGSITSH